MDKFDIKILKELEIDARMSNAKIGKKIGRSQQFVEYRIELMRKRKPDPVITPQIVLNQYKLGLRSFLLFVKLEKVSSNE